MRAFVIIALGVLVAALLAGPAAAQTETIYSTESWDVAAHRTPEGGLHCSYYRPGTVVREQRLRGADEERALRFHDVEKWEPNQRVRAYEGEPVTREQPLREATLFATPTGYARIAEKWNYQRCPTPEQDKYAAPTAWGEDMGRGAMMAPPQRPPTYIAGAQQKVTDLSRYEAVDGCLYLRPAPPSALQQVNNRQFSPQWHF